MEQKTDVFDEQKLQQLAKHAGTIAEMLKHVLKKEEETDLTACLLYAAGLAGIACHETVKALKQPFARVTTASGKAYYFGDRVNYYLLENPYSVCSFITPVCPLSKEAIERVIASAAQNVGTERFQVWGMPAEAAYRTVYDCWKGIFDNMTSVWCSDPSEWPVLYALLTQNILNQCLQAGVLAEEAGRMALECAALLSKMDKESL